MDLNVLSELSSLAAFRRCYQMQATVFPPLLFFCVYSRVPRERCWFSVKGVSLAECFGFQSDCSVNISKAVYITVGVLSLG